MSERTIQEAAERLVAEVANHRFIMQHAHDTDSRFADDIEIVAQFALGAAERLAVIQKAITEQLQASRENLETAEQSGSPILSYLSRGKIDAYETILNLIAALQAPATGQG